MNEDMNRKFLSVSNIETGDYLRDINVNSGDLQG